MVRSYLPGSDASGTKQAELRITKMAEELKSHVGHRFELWSQLALTVGLTKSTVDTLPCPSESGGTGTDRLQVMATRKSCRSEVVSGMVEMRESS
jgi:hypothetical protein